MAYVVYIVGAAIPTPHDGRWLVQWNPNTEAGTLACESTENIQLARRFSSQGDAFDEWKTISNVQPIRPWDGKPNRPLAALTITCDRVDE